MKLIVCGSCEAEFSIRHIMDTHYYSVDYCPFCASRVGGASGGASSAGVNRSSQCFGNSVSSQSRFSSKNNKLSQEQQQELFQLLSTIENLNVTHKMIETFSNQLVTADILLHNINYSGLSKIRLTVGETSLIWTAIVLYRINSGDGLPTQF